MALGDADKLIRRMRESEGTEQRLKDILGRRMWVSAADMMGREMTIREVGNNTKMTLVPDDANVSVTERIGVLGPLINGGQGKDMTRGGNEIFFYMLSTVMYKITCTPTFCDCVCIAKQPSCAMCQIGKKEHCN